MALRRLRVEFYDDSGCRHTISLEGPLSREKVARVLDYAELMGGLAPELTRGPVRDFPRTKLERIRDLVFHNLRESTFCSEEVRALYRQTYGDPIPLTTVATYLARLTDRGLMRRSFSSGRWRYCLANVASNLSSQ